MTTSTSTDEDADEVDTARRIRDVLLSPAAQNRPTETWAYAEIADWYELTQDHEFRPRAVVLDISDPGIPPHSPGFEREVWRADTQGLNAAVAWIDMTLSQELNVENLRDMIDRRTAGLRQVGLDLPYGNLEAGLRRLWRMTPPGGQELIAAGLIAIPRTINPRELSVGLNLLAAAAGRLR